ncbi:MAG: EVE domain-containing protein [Bdellovibrionaceae bacterium]|nr:EVE domain-containing protein [Pseudobdellovibrionaceae bacterium]
MKYWLMKSEPDVYSITDLKKNSTTWWEGVRNYQARNFMTKDMSPGDLVLFYHSNAEPSGVAGIAKVSKSAEPDQTQFDKKSEYFEAKASVDKPRWYCVQIEYVGTFKKTVSLADLKQQKDLKDLPVLQKGSRLSVQPVTKTHFEIIKTLGGL